MLEPDEIERRAAATVRASGEQWTTMRARLFRLMLASGRPVSAYEAGKALSDAEGRPIAVTSIYRILALFVARGIVSRIESLNAYLVTTDAIRRDGSIFLICDDCRIVTQIGGDDLHHDALAAVRAVGFLPARLVAEVRGVCGQCRTARAPLH